MKPTFCIIGVMKAITSGIHNQLSKHPSICTAIKGELHFFSRDENYNKGIDWYEKQFYCNEKKDIKHVGEKTPSYIFLEKAMIRIKKHYPDIKLIVVLREPISRAYSNYNHIQQVSANHRLGKYKNLSLSEYIKHDLKKGDSYQHELSIIQRGYYINQINFLYKHFPKKNVKIIIGEHYSKNSLQELNNICKFLNISAFKSIKNVIYENTRQYPTPISKKDYDTLQQIYKPYNEKLYKFLGYRIKEWDSASYDKMISYQKDNFKKAQQQKKEHGYDDTINFSKYFKVKNVYVVAGLIRSGTQFCESLLISNIPTKILYVNNASSKNLAQMNNYSFRNNETSFIVKEDIPQSFQIPEIKSKFYTKKDLSAYINDKSKTKVIENLILNVADKSIYKIKELANKIECENIYTIYVVRDILNLMSSRIEYNNPQEIPYDVETIKYWKEYIDYLYLKPNKQMNHIVFNYNLFIMNSNHFENEILSKLKLNKTDVFDRLLIESDFFVKFRNNRNILQKYKKYKDNHLMKGLLQNKNVGKILRRFFISKL